VPRNLNHRVEVLFPIEDSKFVRHLRDEVLAVYLSDNDKARSMSSNGSYARRVPGDGQPLVNSQAWFLKPRASSPNPRDPLQIT
jgi:polyphosphate kinase